MYSPNIGNDYESLSTPDSDIIPDGYQRLNEIETETKVTIHRSEDDEICHNRYGRSDEKKIKLSLSQEQISGRKHESESKEIKKSLSASFDFSGVKMSALPRSSSIQIDKLKNIDLKTNKTNNLFSYIYDSPRRISVPAVNSPPDYIPSIPPIYKAAVNLNNSVALHEVENPPTDVNRLVEDRFKCGICKMPFTDPRVLDCLHSFCLQCLLEADSQKNSSSANFWQKFGENSNSEVTERPEPSNSGSDPVTVTEEPSIIIRRPSIMTFRARRQSYARIGKVRSVGRNSSTISFQDKPRVIICLTCNCSTELPIGGVFRLPQNFIISRKVQAAILKAEFESAPTIMCQLCVTQTIASSFCFNCNLHICDLCKDSHKRQRITSNHEIRSIAEIKMINLNIPNKKNRTVRCPIHPSHELKIFCTSCHQVCCSDCTILLHRGHKCESVVKAIKVYLKLIKSSLEKTRPLTDYANHTILKLNGISKKINVKCDSVQNEVEGFLADYLQGLEVHRQTLLNQIGRAKENKIETIRIHQNEIEKHSMEAQTAIDFTEDLLNDGCEVEILSFVGLLMKKFSSCQKSNIFLDTKISESLQFLPEVKAPSTKAQNNIPLYGIITTQTAVPKFCTLQTEGLMNLRVLKKAELVMVSRDGNDRPLCHGGLIIYTELRYRDVTGRWVPTQVSDKRDGTYLISFIPDTAGILNLTIEIKNKSIKNSPFSLCARALRPHSGIFHCCSFCSTGGSKLATCACLGTMNDFNGCGHGHDGHPGRRHWSCCANILENSECSKANAATNYSVPIM